MSEQSENWAKVRTATGDTSKVWNVGNDPAIHPVSGRSGEELESILTHCRQHPDRWEVLEPVSDDVFAAVKHAHGSLRPNKERSVMLIVEEADLLRNASKETIEQTSLMIGDISRLGRSFGVHLVLVTG